MLFSASAFADSRPERETNWRDNDRGSARRDNDSRDRVTQRGNDSRNGSYRGESRREPFYANGRVSRVQRHGDVYRVWVGGARYPFYVPRAHYNRDRFRVGVVINIGGYYNPAGHYDYYDGRYSGRGYSSGDLRGSVESVDYRRDTFVLRNERTGHYVTVVMRDRRLDVRPGDYVELYGDWSRNVFRAYDVDLLDRGYYRR